MTEAAIKIALSTQCKEQLATRRAGVQKILDNVAISLQEETKSSAGDKHETGRAMLQLERENAGKQLAEIEKLEAIIQRVSVAVEPGPVHLGSVVKTSQANYYLSIPSGAITVHNEVYYAMGVGAPIAQLLLGKKVGDAVRFRESVINITHIF